MARVLVPAYFINVKVYFDPIFPFKGRSQVADVVHGCVGTNGDRGVAVGLYFFDRTQNISFVRGWVDQTSTAVHPSQLVTRTKDEEMVLDLDLGSFSFDTNASVLPVRCGDHGGLLGFYCDCGAVCWKKEVVIK